MSNPGIVVAGLAVAVGLPMYYVVIKRRAASSLAGLLSERFSPRPCPVSNIHTELGPLLFSAAYDDQKGTGLVLLIANLRRSKTAYLHIGGFFKPGGDASWLDRVRNQPGVIVATPVEGGALAMWKGLPSRESVPTHLDSVS